MFYSVTKFQVEFVTVFALSSDHSQRQEMEAGLKNQTRPENQNKLIMYLKKNSYVTCFY